MSNNKLKFRKSLNGYNRQDVNEYIATMDRKYSGVESEYQRVFAEQKEIIDELDIKAAASDKLSKSNEEKDRELEVLRAKQSECDVLIGELNDALDRLKVENERLRVENAAIKAKIEELERQAELCGEAYEKSGIYDKVSGQIGSLIINANARAEGIVSEATLKARASASAIINDTTDFLNELNEKCTGKISERAGEFLLRIQELSRDMESFGSEMKLMIQDECNRAKDIHICGDNDHDNE